MWNHVTTFEAELLRQLNTPQPKAEVEITSGGPGISLERTAQGWNLCLKQENMLGRAAAILEENADRPIGWKYQETPAYEKLGVMLDCSRNAVPKPETLEKFLCILSRMGYNTVQLYMEDVYELEGYPYFGYGRGRYTKEELKRLDRFAAGLGIELIPAIQTLAHLGQSLKWKAMKDLVDVGDILLIDDPETYTLIRKMFAVMRECFSTHRINIGMDEAHMVGLGKFLDRNGYQNRTQLMLRHFQKVHEIAKSYDFTPMMWSDMFFRLASGGDYYAPECHIDPEVARTIPEDTTLVYWDYYSEDRATYDRMLDRHAQLCPNVIFAGGAWKWSGFAPCNQFSMKLADLASASCTEHGVNEVLITMWGDNGAECSMFAVLPTLQYWAELCWSGKREPQEISRRLETSAGACWEDFMNLDQLLYTPDNPAPGRCAVNASKTMLYEDLLMPLFSPALDSDAWVQHLHACVSKLENAARKDNDWKVLFASYSALARYLEEKMVLRQHLIQSWEEKNLEQLKAVAQEISKLQNTLRQFIQAFHSLWLWENKAAGLDVFDLRVGGQMQRLDTARERLEAYLAGRTQTLEELDEPWLPFDPAEWDKGHRDSPAPFWHEIASPSSLAMI